MNDYYKTLGIDKKASLADIKKTYRKLARKYHPDLNPGDAVAEKKFKEITEAYEILRDPDKRKQYDTFGSVGGPFGANRGGRSPHFDGFNFNTSGSNSFGDIFETFFGARQQSQGGRSRKPERGEDLRYSMNLNFMDAALGLETPIQVLRKELCTNCSGKGIEPGTPKQKCPTCDGEGRIPKQTGFMKFATPCTNCDGSGYLPGKSCGTCYGEGRVDKVIKKMVKIPGGVDGNSKVRIAGIGNVGRFGGPTGDLVIAVNVSPHKFFKRSGANLELLLPVTYREAALGAKVEVPTLEGYTRLKIPPSTASGQKLRIKGKGLTSPTARGKGDMIIEIKIVPPPTEDIEVRELLKRIEEKAPYNPRTEFES